MSSCLLPTNTSLITDPHCSVNSLHLHIVDLSATGPSFGACAAKNLGMDAVVEALQADIGAFEAHADGQQALALPADHAPVDEMHRTDTEPQASRCTSAWC